MKPHRYVATSAELANVKTYSSADAVKDATKKAFGKLGNKATGVNPEYEELQTVIGSIKRDANGNKLLGSYKQYHATVRDPKRDFTMAHPEVG